MMVMTKRELENVGHSKNEMLRIQSIYLDFDTLHIHQSSQLLNLQQRREENIIIV